MTDWRDIKSAPKDGTVIEVAVECDFFVRFPYRVKARFSRGVWQFKLDGRWSTFEPQPTHWMPLPEPPE